MFWNFCEPEDKMQLTHTLILFLFLFTGCETKSHTEIKKEETAPSIGNADMSSTNTNSKLDAFLLTPINKKEVIEKYDLLSTTTFLSNKSKERYNTNSNCQSVGAYFLISQEDTIIEQVGRLIVCVNGMPWKSNSPSEDFLEIESETKDIVFKYGLRVGLPFRDFENVLGKPVYRQNKLQFYTNRLNHTAVITVDKNEIVTTIKAGHYRLPLDTLNIPEHLIE